MLLALGSSQTPVLEHVLSVAVCLEGWGVPLHSFLLPCWMRLAVLMYSVRSGRPGVWSPGDGKWRHWVRTNSWISCRVGIPNKAVSSVPEFWNGVTKVCSMAFYHKPKHSSMLKQVSHFFTVGPLSALSLYIANVQYGLYSMFPNTSTMEPLKNGACWSTSFPRIYFGKCYSLGLCKKLCKTLHTIKHYHQLPPHWKRALSSAQGCASSGLVSVSLSLPRIHCPPPQPNSEVLSPVNFPAKPQFEGSC